MRLYNNKLSEGIAYALAFVGLQATQPTEPNQQLDDMLRPLRKTARENVCAPPTYRCDICNYVGTASELDDCPQCGWDELVLLPEGKAE